MHNENTCLQPETIRGSRPDIIDAPAGSLEQKLKPTRRSAVRFRILLRALTDPRGEARSGPFSGETGSDGAE